MVSLHVEGVSQQTLQHLVELGFTRKAPYQTKMISLEVGREGDMEKEDKD